MNENEHSNALKTLYSEDFNCDKYIYHYTTFETALKIIHSNQLLFSHLNKTNDSSEKMIKISFTPKGFEKRNEYDKMSNTIKEYFEEYHKLFQVICFCRDYQLDEGLRKAITKMSSKEKYYDYSGRGFALPRMWAQYGENSTGVCLILNKETILSLVKKCVAIYVYNNVSYHPFYHAYRLDKERMYELYNMINQPTNGSYTMLSLIKDDFDFISYNFFEKNSDWENEREFRIIAMTDTTAKEKRISIKSVLSALEGIVVGENVEDINILLLKAVLKERKKDCKIRRLVFSDRLYRIKEE